MKRRSLTALLIILLVFAAVAFFHKKEKAIPPSTLAPATIVTDPKDPKALMLFRTCQSSTDDTFCTQYGPPDTIDKRHQMFLFEKEKCGILKSSVDPSPPNPEYKVPKSCIYTPSPPPSSSSSPSLPYLSLPVHNPDLPHSP